MATYRLSTAHATLDRKAAVQKEAGFTTQCPWVVAHLVAQYCRRPLYTFVVQLCRKGDMVAGRTWLQCSSRGFESGTHVPSPEETFISSQVDYILGWHSTGLGLHFEWRWKKHRNTKWNTDVWTPAYTPTDRLTSWGVLHHPCTVHVCKLLFIRQ